MPTDDFRAKYGPWALVAGASEGTGAAFSRQLAAAGINLILVARREGPLDAVAAEILAAHPGVQVITATIDLARKDAAERVAQVAEGREVGLLILNAGADPNGATFLDNDLSNWIDLTQRNVVTVLKACHHFAGLMRPRGRGGLILVNSGACYMGLPGCSVYGATKAYDLVLGEALWAELAPDGIDVLNLVMGQTDTPAYRELMAKKGIPFPTGTANPEDVAALGLARLPHGPTTNWGEADDAPGMTFSSAAQRRERIRMIAAHSMKFGAKE